MLNELNKIAADMLGMQGFPLRPFSRDEAAASDSRTTSTRDDSSIAADRAVIDPAANASLRAAKIAA